jgi:high-affinity nickel-transport protein
MIGSIVGTSVSAAFLILLGIMNIYILYKLVQELRKHLRKSESDAFQLNFEGAGCMFGLLRRLFRIVDRSVSFRSYEKL